LNVEPIGNKIFVEREEAQSVTEGGIHLPEKAKELPCRGEVLAVGPGQLMESGSRHILQIQKGNKVLFPSYAGTEVTLSGTLNTPGERKYLIMDEADVLCILR